jgi:cytidine deaminase
MDKNEFKELLQIANIIRKNAYAPYSKFKVGCAILLEDGSVVSGVNIENAAYGVALCAERSAMAPIVTAGNQNKIKALAVVTDSVPPGSPCGMCRQFLSEFLPLDTPIILGNGSLESIETSLEELLPLAFNRLALQPL